MKNLLKISLALLTMSMMQCYASMDNNPQGWNDLIQTVNDISQEIVDFAQERAGWELDLENRTDKPRSDCRHRCTPRTNKGHLPYSP